MHTSIHIRALPIAVIAGVALAGSALAIDADLVVDDAVLADAINVKNDHIRLKTNGPY